MATKRSLPEFVRSELVYYSNMGVYIESASVVTKGREYQYDTILSLVTNIHLSNNNSKGVDKSSGAEITQLFRQSVNRIDPR